MFQETDEFSRHHVNPTMFVEHLQAAWTVGCAGFREVGGVRKLLSGPGTCLASSQQGFFSCPYPSR